MEPIREDETEFLASLEERIVKAVELVGALRKENATLENKLKAALQDQDSADVLLAESKDEITKLNKELDSMRAERKQVRTRIEKLLGQMDLLSAS